MKAKRNFTAGASLSMDGMIVFDWTGRKCAKCGGCGETNDLRRCGQCAGTGEEYGPVCDAPRVRVSR